MGAWVLAALVVALVGATPAYAISPNLVISQVYGGGGNSGAPVTHDYIEVFNRGTSTVALDGLSLQYTSATGTGNFGANSAQQFDFPGGLLAPGQYVLVQEASGGANGVPLSPAPDFVDPTPINMSATGGKVALVSGTTSLGCNGGSTPCAPAALARIVDLIGYDGANFFEGASPAPTLSNTTAAFRASDGCKDTDNNGADFFAAAPAPRNALTPLHFCPTDDPPSITNRSPANGAANVAVDASVSVTFSEPVNVTGSWYSISCGLSGSHTATVSGGPATFTLDPDVDFAQAETCTVTVFAANVGDQDTNDPPDNMEANDVWTFTTSGPTPPSGDGLASPTVVFQGGAVTLAVKVTPGANPTSTGITVTADLTAIGGSATQAFFDDGTHGDLVANDNLFTFATTVPLATPTGFKTLSAAIADAEGRSGSALISFSVLAATAVRIHDIQAASHTSPKVGQAVSGVTGIVTAKRSNGYYMQDPDPDADDATSEGIFVFTSSAPSSVNVGDSVRVSGNVAEFRPGGSSSTNLTTTEITSPTTIVTTSGSPLPVTTIVGAGGRVPPTEVIEDDASGSVETSGSFDPAQDGIDFYESLEGMRVQVNNPVVVGPRNSFGEVWVLGDNGAAAAARTARGGIVIRDLDAPFDYQSGDFDPERIQLDDNVLLNSTPNANVGDHFTGPAIGVVDYEFGNFEIDVTSALTRVADGVTREVTAAPAAHELTVATFNVENLAGNELQAKYDALAAEIVTNLRSPDVLSLEEIQDNNGATNDSVVDAGQTLGRLVAAIQAAGGPTYDWRQINPIDDQDGGQPGGNIRVGFLFRTDRGLAFVDRPGGGSTTPTSVVSGPGGPQLSSSPGRIDPTNSAWNASRKPLAGEFTYRGETFFLIANHFNSKGGDEPLFGRSQPPARSSEVQRHQQAQIVNNFVDSILALDSNANVIVLGDLNDFEFSQTVSFLEGGVLHALMKTLPQNERYSYVFEGNSQSLDHIVVSDRLFGDPFVYDPVHVNAEFFDQISDHDPQVARFLVNSAPVADAGGPYSVVEGGSVSLSALGTDVNGDPLTYAWDLDGNGTFETLGQTVAFSPDDGPASPTVTVRVTDDGGLSSVDSATVNVANMAPTVTAVTPNSTNGLVGEPVTFTGTATDPSAADTAAGFAWAFNTGSGFGPFGSNPLAITYSTCGTYTVAAKARDKDGGVSDPLTSPVVHVYIGSVLAPLQVGSFNLVQAGRIVPVKITVGCGGFLSGLHPAISIRAGDFDPSVDPSDPSYEVPPTNSAADTSGVMREGDEQYLYNLGVPSNATTGQLFTVLIRPFGGSAPTLYAVLKIK